jgi:RNA polymerase sigma factor (sigma-70 family)
MDRPSDLSAALSGLAAEQYRTRRSEELLGLFLRDRDPAAFRALVERHGGAVLRACRAVLRRRDLAEDAFQETFRRLAQKGHLVRRASAVGQWLAVTARRTALSLRLREERRMKRERQVAGSAARSAPVAADEALAGREEAAAAVAALARLPDRYRLPLELVYLDGLTHAEAALALGCPKGTVDSAVSRGLGKLRATLARTAPAAAGAVGVEALLAGQAQALSRDLVAEVVRLALATAAEPATPLAVAGLFAARLPRWTVAAAAVTACGLGYTLLRPGAGPADPGPAQPAAAGRAEATTESLPDRNARVLRDEILPRVVEALRPLALNGGDVRVTRLETFDFRSWFEVELRHGKLPFGPSVTRLRVYFDTDNGAEYVFIDTLGTGRFELLRPNEPIILLLQPRLALRVDPLDRAIAALRELPHDPRAEEEATRQARLVLGALAPYRGTWRRYGDPARATAFEYPPVASADTLVSIAIDTGRLAVRLRDIAVDTSGGFRLWWQPHTFRLTEGGRRLVWEGTPYWWDRAP